MEHEALAILELMSVKGVGPAKIRSILPSYEMYLHEYKKAGLINHGWVDSVRESCLKNGVEIVAFSSDLFPESLRLIKDCPVILYCKGNTSLLRHQKRVSVVGTRKASSYGIRAARKISFNLSDRGFCVVSGLALGIDRESHLGSIEGGTPGIAVLASGPEKATPTSNSDIYEGLIRSNGLIVSEHEPGFPVVKTELVKRNRIQSGLSSHSIIIETGATGGTITQAKYALEQGRGILTMLANSESPSSFNCDYSGANRLVAEFGAKGFSSWEELVAKVSTEEK